MAAVSISGHRFGRPRLVRGITGLLWRDEQRDVLVALSAFAVPAMEVPQHVQATLRLDSGGPGRTRRRLTFFWTGLKIDGWRRGEHTITVN